MKRTLTTHSGETIARFSAAGVRRALMDPVSICGEVSKDYAMVWCEDAEVYITRHGKGARTCSFTVTHWESDNEDAPQQELEFENSKREDAIKLFLRLAKRDPLYASS